MSRMTRASYARAQTSNDDNENTDMNHDRRASRPRPSTRSNTIDMSYDDNPDEVSNSTLSRRTTPRSHRKLPDDDTDVNEDDQRIIEASNRVSKRLSNRRTTSVLHEMSESEEESSRKMRRDRLKNRLNQITSDPNNNQESNNTSSSSYSTLSSRPSWRSRSTLKTDDPKLSSTFKRDRSVDEEPLSKRFKTDDLDNISQVPLSSSPSTELSDVTRRQRAQSRSRRRLTEIAMLGKNDGEDKEIASTPIKTYTPHRTTLSSKYDEDLEEHKRDDYGDSINTRKSNDEADSDSDNNVGVNPFQRARYSRLETPTSPLKNSKTITPKKSYISSPTKSSLENSSSLTNIDSTSPISPVKRTTITMSPYRSLSSRMNTTPVTEETSVPVNDRVSVSDEEDEFEELEDDEQFNQSYDESHNGSVSPYRPSFTSTATDSNTSNITGRYRYSVGRTVTQDLDSHPQSNEPNLLVKNTENNWTSSIRVPSRIQSTSSYSTNPTPSAVSYSISTPTSTPLANRVGLTPIMSPLPLPTVIADHEYSETGTPVPQRIPRRVSRASQSGKSPYNNAFISPVRPSHASRSNNGNYSSESLYESDDDHEDYSDEQSVFSANSVSNKSNYVQRLSFDSHLSHNEHDQEENLPSLPEASFISSKSRRRSSIGVGLTPRRQTIQPNPSQFSHTPLHNNLNSQNYSDFEEDFEYYEEDEEALDQVLEEALQESEEETLIVPEKSAEDVPIARWKKISVAIAAILVVLFSGAYLFSDVMFPPTLFCDSSSTPPLSVDVKVGGGSWFNGGNGVVTVNGGVPLSSEDDSSVTTDITTLMATSNVNKANSQCLSCPSLAVCYRGALYCPFPFTTIRNNLCPRTTIRINPQTPSPSNEDSLDNPSTETPVDSSVSTQSAISMLSEEDLAGKVVISSTSNSVTVVDEQCYTSTQCSDRPLLDAVAAVIHENVGKYECQNVLTSYDVVMWVHSWSLANVCYILSYIPFVNITEDDIPLPISVFLSTLYYMTVYPFTSLGLALISLIFPDIHHPAPASNVASVDDLAHIISSLYPSLSTSALRSVTLHAMHQLQHSTDVHQISTETINDSMVLISLAPVRSYMCTVKMWVTEPVGIIILLSITIAFFFALKKALQLRDYVKLQYMYGKSYSHLLRRLQAADKDAYLQVNEIRKIYDSLISQSYPSVNDSITSPIKYGKKPVTPVSNLAPYQIKARKLQLIDQINSAKSLANVSKDILYEELSMIGDINVIWPYVLQCIVADDRISESLDSRQGECWRWTGPRDYKYSPIVDAVNQESTPVDEPPKEEGVVSKIINFLSPRKTKPVSTPMARPLVSQTPSDNTIHSLSSRHTLTHSRRHSTPKSLRPVQTAQTPLTPHDLSINASTSASVSTPVGNGGLTPRRGSTPGRRQSFFKPQYRPMPQSPASSNTPVISVPPTSSSQTPVKSFFSSVASIVTSPFKMASSFMSSSPPQPVSTPVVPSSVYYPQKTQESRSPMYTESHHSHNDSHRQENYAREHAPAVTTTNTRVPPVHTSIPPHSQVPVNRVSTRPPMNKPLPHRASERPTERGDRERGERSDRMTGTSGVRRPVVDSSRSSIPPSRRPPTNSTGTTTAGIPSNRVRPSVPSSKLHSRPTGVPPSTRSTFDPSSTSYLKKTQR